MTQFYWGAYSGIDTDVYENCIIVGGKGGTLFEFESLDKGAIVKEIKAWVTKNVLHGIEVTLTDDSSSKFGRAEDINLQDTTKGEFLFRNHETITSLVIESEEKCTPEDKKGCLRGLHIKTSEGRSWSLGSKKAKKKVQMHEYPVASGICCGVFGFCDDEMLYQLGFAMLKPVKEAVLLDFRVLPNKDNFIKIPEIIESLTTTNTSSDVQETTFKTMVSVTTTTTIGYTLSLGRIFGVKIRPSDYRMFKFERTSNDSISTETNKEETGSRTETKEFEWPITTPAKTKVIATAKIFRCELGTEYEADIEVKLMNGKVIKYKRVHNIYYGIFILGKRHLSREYKTGRLDRDDRRIPRIRRHCVERKKGDLKQDSVAAPTSTYQTPQVKTQRRHTQQATRNSKPDIIYVERKIQHINHCDPWAISADSGRPSATLVTDGLVILDYERKILPLFRSRRTHNCCVKEPPHYKMTIQTRQLNAEVQATQMNMYTVQNFQTNTF
ncbi:hypothetical protein FSP39_018606 [Pinctada imbricata]|uniref:Jacalin-type lectin domain-containing protein n=1 Tax=Pinctada imbricata TaxID=66713 RepID=A0AA88YK66_PINIB|nr:hypothetical protein FSP39_018606 [Pinctada imbricata]